jgi:hypothetical protein
MYGTSKIGFTTEDYQLIESHINRRPHYDRESRRRFQARIRFDRTDQIPIDE